MQCRVCGKEIQPDSRFCSYCGAKLDGRAVNDKYRDAILRTKNIAEGICAKEFYLRFYDSLNTVLRVLMMEQMDAIEHKTTKNKIGRYRSRTEMFITRNGHNERFRMDLMSDNELHIYEQFRDAICDAIKNVKDRNLR